MGWKRGTESPGLTHHRQDRVNWGAPFPCSCYGQSNPNRSWEFAGCHLCPPCSQPLPFDPPAKSSAHMTVKPLKCHFPFAPRESPTCRPKAAPRGVKSQSPVFPFPTNFRHTGTPGTDVCRWFQDLPTLLGCSSASTCHALVVGYITLPCRSSF